MLKKLKQKNTDNYNLLLVTNKYKLFKRYLIEFR